MKENVGKSLSNESTEVQKTYEDIDEAVRQTIHEDLVDGRKRKKPHFQVDYARSAVSAGDTLLRRSLGVQSSIGKSLALFSIP